MLTDLEKRVILALQRDLEVEPRPFKELADLLGLEEEVVLAAIRSLMEKGYIRRFGATLRHQKSGFEANALVAWKVPEAELRADRPGNGGPAGGQPLLLPAAGPGLAV